MAEVYWVGRGSPSWRDRRNWSRRSGGTPGAQAPTGVETVVLDAGSGDADVNLDGCPYRALQVRPGFRGKLSGPFGDSVSFGRGLPAAEGGEGDEDAPAVPRVVDFREQTPARCPFCGQSDTIQTGEHSVSVSPPFSAEMAARLEEVGIDPLDAEPVEFVWAGWSGDGTVCSHVGPEIVASLDLIGPYQAVE